MCSDRSGLSSSVPASVFPFEELKYNGAEIDLSKVSLPEHPLFKSRLQNTVDFLGNNGKTSVYVKVDLSQAHLIPAAG